GEKDETHKNLLNYFDTIMTPEYYSKMKPHPSGILNIVRKWKLPKEKILMVGDMTLDINAAKSAGVIAVGITTGYDSKEVLEKAGADYIINSLSELIPLLDKILEK
ncbi:MAG: HAD family hydrolase, partial [Promethearchaeota archaeon]